MACSNTLGLQYVVRDTVAREKLLAGRDHTSWLEIDFVVALRANLSLAPVIKTDKFKEIRCQFISTYMHSKLTLPHFRGI
jgi:hypothetical protein